MARRARRWERRFRRIIGQSRRQAPGADPRDHPVSRRPEFHRDEHERGIGMSHWESQIRTNLEDTVYSNLLDRGIASTPGTLAAGLVNIRYGEGCLRGPAAEQAPESEL